MTDTNQEFLKEVAMRSIGLPDDVQRQILELAEGGQPRRKLISRKVVLQRLHVSPPTLRALIRRGALHVFRLSPRKHRFDLAEVEALENGNRELSA